ncbi:pseudouridine synthase [Tilletiaria anomala UBC 951]|uniref:Pseudouridine synthase n=1 Tax=Tilletiaria anomala (strain ATCC 24038 / CBS 436.72 / UBC 951) TaxID=1037660 RepID=A0A066VVU6_TILAU|nr:pseudouridine synthase [Tilletiaria anomala UBC 951]KDN45621.1 pseudouridine synthase [Tilletiaria anomala UBC 951]
MGTENAEGSASALPGLRLRTQEPYWHDYTTHAKQRWIGRELLEIFTTEFRDRTKEYYLWAIHKGVCTVNGSKASPRQIVKDGDLIVNRVHRHEPPVTAEPIRILHRDDDAGRLVVIKPGSIPVHSAGRYHRSTLIEMLKADHGISQVHTANRLDRLTSGVMVLSTKKEAASKLAAVYLSGDVRKNYVCRVRGRFPGDGKEVTCEQPILSVDRQSGVNIVHPLGKPCKTIFHRLSYDSATDTSVVWCRPLTGRTHQIRVHVQYLGHPICNDPVYGHAIWEGRSQEDMAKETVSTESWKGEGGTGSTGSSKVDAIIAAIKAQRDGQEDWARWKDEVIYGHLLQEAELELPDLPGANAQTARPAKGKGEEVLKSLGIEIDTQSNRWLKRVETEACGMCDECKIPLLPDPRPEELFIYLHAMKYETEEWCYEDELPWWAREDWQEAISQAERKRGGQMFSSGSAPPAEPVGFSKEFLDPGVELSDPAHPAVPPQQEQDTTVRLLDMCSAPSSSSAPAPACPFPVLFEVFHGLEDFAEQDLQRVLKERGAMVRPPPLGAWLQAGHVRAQVEDGISATLVDAWQDGQVRSAEAAHLVMGEAPLAQEVVQRLRDDRRSGGRSRRREKIASVKAKSAAPKSNAEHTAEVEQEHSSSDHPEKLPQSERDLIALIRKLWDDCLPARDQALAFWRQRRKTQYNAPLQSFRCTFNRCGYLLPTLISKTMEYELSDCVWSWLNGNTKADDPRNEWTVDLKAPQLNIVFKMVPNFGANERPNNLIEHGPPPAGALFVLLELDPPVGESQLRPAALTGAAAGGGTALAFYRAHTLANLARVFPEPGQSEVKLLEPCVGVGRIATEMVATLQNLQLDFKVFACDIDTASIAKADAAITLCNLHDRIKTSTQDATDVDAMAAFLGGRETIDTVVTDLPWGHRVLTKNQVHRLYRNLLPALLALLKPGGHAILMTAEYTLLQRIVAEQQVQSKKDHLSKYRLAFAPLHIPFEAGEDNAEERSGVAVSSARKWGVRMAEESGGLRMARCGHIVGIFDLRKERVL